MTMNIQLKASKDEDTSKEFWNGLADYYIDVTNMFNLSTRVTVENFIKAINIKPGNKILDAGCGHLRISLGILRKEPDISITGIDFTQSLLEQGRDLCTQMDINNIELYQGNIKELPFEDNSFDGVVSARVFQYLDDPVKALSEIFRVLKPGGKVVISVPNRHNLVKRLRYKGKLYTAKELRHFFKQAGFQNVRSGSLCFVPGEFSWESKLRAVEIFSRLPIVSDMGGNAMAFGQK